MEVYSTLGVYVPKTLSSFLFLMVLIFASSSSAFLCKIICLNMLHIFMKILVKQNTSIKATLGTQNNSGEKEKDHVWLSLKRNIIKNTNNIFFLLQTPWGDSGLHISATACSKAASLTCPPPHCPRCQPTSTGEAHIASHHSLESGSAHQMDSGRLVNIQKFRTFGKRKLCQFE